MQTIHLSKTINFTKYPKWLLIEPGQMDNHIQMAEVMKCSHTAANLVENKFEIFACQRTRPEILSDLVRLNEVWWQWCKNKTQNIYQPAAKWGFSCPLIKLGGPHKTTQWHICHSHSKDNNLLYQTHIDNGRRLIYCSTCYYHELHLSGVECEDVRQVYTWLRWGKLMCYLIYTLQLIN